MYNHEPKGYRCPFCSIGKNKQESFSKFKRSTSIYHDRYISAFISLKQWPHNSGIVIIIPNRHYENLYDIPDPMLAKINSLAKRVAIAMKKVYGCDGISTRQHNEPAGNQSVWHFHLHVFPRYKNDELYINHTKSRNVSNKDRTMYATQLKKYLK